ncbi:MAG TPA: alpha-1,2-fucosyltransferase, partial [Archaeoglobus profundus]|nr:alpha-1,2-fucosyltransferase [Archaeoglobus profundus]
GYWQTEKYFSDIRTDILKDFTVKEKNTEIVDNYLKQINNSNSVSIHVRRGDYLNHPDIGVLDISYYKNAIEYIYNKVENPTFYIFSNDISWCEKNLDFIDDKIIINNTKSEIEDISLMKNCKYNIIANSSFSWWSAWLNINPSKIIIAPKIWMVKNPNNCKWVPDSWIEL